MNPLLKIMERLTIDKIAWIPVWAFGRRFEKGKNTERLPEQTLGILMG